MYVYGNGCKRRAEEMNEDDVTNGMMMDEESGVHGRICASKRTRMMHDLVPTHDESGAKSTTPVEPSNGDDSDSSQLTNLLKTGSGKQAKKNTINYIKKSHGSSWRRGRDL